MTHGRATWSPPRHPPGTGEAGDRMAGTLERRILAPTAGRRRAAQALRRLMDQLSERFAPAHEQRLRRALRLAKVVELAHGPEADCPNGVAAHLAMLDQCLRAHRRREDLILTEATGGRDVAETRIQLAALRAEHDAIDQHLMRLAVLTHDFTPPVDADPTWRRLYRVCRELDRDLREQMRLEGDVVYPCLDGSNDAAPRPVAILTDESRRH